MELQFFFVIGFEDKRGLVQNAKTVLKMQQYLREKRQQHMIQEVTCWGT